MCTQLQLVNEVLILLREDEVTSVNTNTYSKLISKFLNQAKREVEDAWDWSFLRTFALIPVVAGITTYAIPGTNKRSKISYVLENNEQYTLYKFTNEEIDYFKVMDTTTGQPYAYVTRGLSASNVMQIELFPIPDKSYVLKPRWAR